MRINHQHKNFGLDVSKKILNVHVYADRPLTINTFQIWTILAGKKKLQNESLIHSNYFKISERPNSSNQLALTKAGENGRRMIDGTKSKSRGI